MKPWIHTFEANGLGKAPFVCIGYSRETYQACQGAPVQPAGTCDRCGQGIMHVFHVRSADGRVSKVGIDCVEHTDDNALEAAARKAQRDYQWSERRARWAAEAAPREAANAAAFLAQCEATEGLAEALECGHDICADLLAKGKKFGSLSEKQVAFALRLARETEEAKNPKPAPVVPATWKPGQRVTLTATYERSVCLEGRGYRGGNKWGHTFRDVASGVALTWWTDGKGDCCYCEGAVRHERGYIRDDSSGKPIAGPWRIVVTVEKIGEYKGEPQVTLGRAKVAPVDPVAALAKVFAVYYSNTDFTDPELTERVCAYDAASLADMYCLTRWGMREVCDVRAAFALAFPGAVTASVAA